MSIVNLESLGLGRLDFVTACLGWSAAAAATAAATPPTNGSSAAPLGASTVAPSGMEYCDIRYAGLYSGPAPNQGSQTAAVIWTLVALATMFMALRIYCKIWRLRRLWWDDWVLVIGWMCFVVDAAMSQAVVDLGFGMYPCDVDPRNFRAIAIEGQNVGATVGILAVVWSKTSFAITLLRLTEGKMKAFVWFVIAAMNVIMIVEAIIVWVQCTPVSKTWDPMVPGVCWDTHTVNVYGVFAGCFSGCCDILLAMLPWTLVWNLRMQKKEKFGIGIAMSMGVFAGATAFVKSAKILTIGSKNFSYDGCALLVWAAAEISTTIMASCIPVLRVFVREVHERSAHVRSAGYKKQVKEITGGSSSTQAINTVRSNEDPPIELEQQKQQQNSKSPPVDGPSTDDVVTGEEPSSPVSGRPVTVPGAAVGRAPEEQRRNMIIATRQFYVEYDDDDYDGGRDAREGGSRQGSASPRPRSF
ncbi:hypothetical protein B0T22DRAFT_536254 [Podospora appendiculata]|uniref:Rhodopsin domain-containing protein n=1 Tax=Podospora appendiculata TaxID=314037 RepID=A0AAE0XB40_9PEZI|nr:hypothetical protein B0T22DRAFT_536254 [Podospora appendiculata]